MCSFTHKYNGGCCRVCVAVHTAGICTCVIAYLSVNDMRAVLTVSKLVWCSASRYKQQQVGSVCYFKIIGLVTTTQDRKLILIPSNHQTEKERNGRY